MTGVLEAGDFKIDLGERTVALRGQELRLMSEECDVLVFLAGHPRRVVATHPVGDKLDGQSSPTNRVLKGLDFAAPQA